MKQNTGKNSAVSTSVKKYFSPHTAVSSLNTTLTHSVTASETVDLLQESTSPERLLATRRHLQTPGWQDVCCHGGRLTLTAASFWFGWLWTNAQWAQTPCSAVLQLLQLFLCTKLNGESNFEPSGAENSYRILLSFSSLFHLFLQLSSCPGRSDVSQVCIFSF